MRALSKPKATHKPDELFLRFTSDPTLLDGACLACTSFALAGGTQSAPHLSLVLRELLSNAVTHGNKNDSSLQVTCRVVRSGAHTAEIEVADEGAGFGFADLDLHLPAAPDDFEHAGLRLVKALTESLRFTAHGSCVKCRVTWGISV